MSGAAALCFASHAYAVVGMEEADEAALIDALIATMTRPKTKYSHRWSLGDVLIWNERAQRHRGPSWPYDEPQTLVSICVTACEG